MSSTKLKDIAAATGLSVATVSKALKHSPEISDATIDLVLRSAADLGYSPRKPKRRPTKAIGLVLPEVISHYYSSLMHSLNRELNRKGYYLITIFAPGITDPVQPFIQKILRYDLDGLFICCLMETLQDEIVQQLIQTRIPTLLLAHWENSYDMDSIFIRDDRGMSLVVDHLVELGHTKIGYLGEYCSDSRYRCFCDSMAQHGLEPVPAYIKRGHERFEHGGYLRAKELLNESTMPTAVIGCYDQFTFGILKAFREEGLVVPRDISIVSFDDTVMADYTEVPLTSVTTPADQMGISATGILLDAINNLDAHVVQNVALQCKLVIRDSTCPPRIK